MTGPPEPVRLVTLRNLLLDNLLDKFSLEDIEELCFRLGIEADNLSGDTRDTKARELIKFLEHRSRLPELASLGKKLRPDLIWELTTGAGPAEEELTQLEENSTGLGGVSKAVVIGEMPAAQALKPSTRQTFLDLLRIVWAVVFLGLGLYFLGRYLGLWPETKSTLILVGSFDIRTANPTVQVDVMQRTYDQLVELSKSKDLSGVRVELIREPILKTDDEARELGRQKGANLVIWGWRDDVGAFIRGIRVDDPSAIPAMDPSDSEIKLLNPTMVPVCLSKEAPMQGTYLAFFSAATAVVKWDDESRLRLAQQMMDLALEAFAHQPSIEDCGSFNPWNGYVIRGLLNEAEARFAVQAKRFPEAMDLHEKAIAAFDGALNLNKDEVSIYGYRANSHYRLSLLQRDVGMISSAEYHVRKSIEDYDSYLATMPKDEVWYTNLSWGQVVLAGILFDRGQVGVAISTCLSAIQTAQSAVTIFESTNTYYARANHEATLALFLDASGDISGSIAARRGAISYYDLAIKVFAPKYVFKDDIYQSKAFSQVELSNLLMRIGSHDESTSYLQQALETYGQALTENPDNELALIQHGKALAKLGRNQEAEIDFRRLIKVSTDPSSVEAAKTELRQMGITP